MHETILGFVASVVGTSIMLPQVYKSFKTKKVDDVSWGMLALYFMNCFLWCMYGLVIHSTPLVVTNSIAMCVSLVQIFLKIKYKNG